MQGRGVAQLGSAPALGAGCRRFKSSRPDHIILVSVLQPGPRHIAFTRPVPLVDPIQAGAPSDRIETTSRRP